MQLPTCVQLQLMELAPPPTLVHHCSQAAWTTTRDYQGLPRHVRGIVAHKESNRSCHVLRSPQAFEPSGIYLSRLLQ